MPWRHLIFPGVNDGSSVSEKTAISPELDVIAELQISLEAATIEEEADSAAPPSIR